MSEQEDITKKITSLRNDLLRRCSRVVNMVENTLYKIENNLPTEYPYQTELGSLDLALDFSKDEINEQLEFDVFIEYWLK